MYKLSVLTLCILLNTGCAAFKKDIGNYVSEAVTQSVEKKIDEKLGTKGLSIAEVKSILDVNKDGNIDKTEIFSTLKDLAKDSAVIEARKLVDSEIKNLQDKMVSKDQLDNKNQSTWNYLLMTALGTVSLYLKNHYTTHSRLGKIEDSIFGEEVTESKPALPDSKEKT